jgi:hypothetical protein
VYPAEEVSGALSYRIRDAYTAGITTLGPSDDAPSDKVFRRHTDVWCMHSKTSDETYRGKDRSRNVSGRI